MALTGNIADWSLADLLQIVAAERKTGALTLTRDGEEVRLEFSAGLLVNASERRIGQERSGRSRPSRRPARNEPPGGFLAFLIKSGHIKPDQARSVILLGRETGEDTANAILKAQLLDPESLGEAMAAYAQDLFSRVLSWEEADYTFLAEKGKPERKGRSHKPTGSGPIALNTEGLLLEGMRRIDEQPRIGQVVQPGTVFVRAAGAPAPVDLDDREATVLELVDGSRDARTLAATVQLGEYEAYEALFLLHQAGLIAERAGPPIVRLRPRHREQGPSAPQSAWLHVVALALILGASLVFRLAAFGTIWPRQSALTFEAPPLTERDLAALHFAAELYTAYTGHEAESVDALVHAGLLPGGFGRWDQASIPRHATRR